MITGAHTIVYSTDDEATRAFFRDVLELPNVDAGGGWLIFRSPPAELAVHPTDGSPKAELYLMCDDITSTVADLEAKGVRFTDEPRDEGWGILTHLEVPGAGLMGLYEPRHPMAI